MIRIVAVVACFVWLTSPAVAVEKPNFVVIMVDAGVSCFGNPYFKTPEIDRLAAEGMKARRFSFVRDGLLADASGIAHRPLLATRWN